jgi:hypothetical protein
MHGGRLSYRVGRNFVADSLIGNCMILDHFAWATPSLQEATNYYERLSGVKPAPGGAHPGKGTRNALVSLGPKLYLAIDGPDHTQTLDNNNGAWMAKLTAPRMNEFVVSVRDIGLTQGILERLGFASEIEHHSRKRADDADIAVLALRLVDHPYGVAMPGFLQWLTDKHPALDAAAGSKLVAFQIDHPESASIRALYADLGLDIQVAQAQCPALRVKIRGRHGQFELT